MGEGLEDVLMPMERTLEIPVSIVPTEAIRAMRIIGEKHGWKMRRLEETTMVHRWAIQVALEDRPSEDEDEEGLQFLATFSLKSLGRISSSELTGGGFVATVPSLN